MTINSASITAAIQARIPQIFIDNITARADFLMWLQSAGKIVRGTDAEGPRWQVKAAASSTATVFAEGAPQGAASEFTMVPASLDWGSFTDTASLTAKAKAKLMNAGGQEKIDGWMVKQIEDHSKQIAALLNTQALGGVTANGLTGITSIIDDANIYADIDRAVLAVAFACHVNDNAGVPRAITAALMDATLDYLLDTIGGSCTELWTGVTQFNKISALSSGSGVFTPYQIMTDGTRLIGYTNIQYRGRPIRVFSGYPSGRVDFVDPTTLRLEVLPTDSDRAAASPDNPLAGAIEFQELANVNGDANYRFQLFAQLRWDDPRFTAASLQDLS